MNSIDISLICDLPNNNVPKMSMNLFYVCMAMLFYPSVWMDLRGLLGVIKIILSGFDGRQLACIKAFYIKAIHELSLLHHKHI